MKRPFSGRPPRLKLPVGAVDTQMHLYPSDFPAADGAPPLPQDAPGPAEYEEVMTWLGIGRVVVTQSNAHQTDNSGIIAGIAALGAKARGVAVVTPETSEIDLARLHEGGIRGARIMDLPGGAVGLDRAPAVDDRIHGLDWVMAVQFDGSHLLSHMPLLEGIKSRYIIDHHGKFFSGITPDDPKIDALKRLIDRGNCWFKLAGCYESSLSGPPDYADLGAVARVIVAHAPERVIWGTNWPHVLIKTEPGYPDDAALLDLVGTWIDSERDRQMIFVDNPSRLFGFED